MNISPAFRRSFAVCWLFLAAVVVLPPVTVSAQTATALHVFSEPQYVDGNLDGDRPSRALLLAGGVLYGTTEKGGMNGRGTIFRVNPDGSGFALLHQFNGDAAGPRAALIISGSTLYGTTSEGGTWQRGHGL